MCAKERRQSNNNGESKGSSRSSQNNPNKAGNREGWGKIDKKGQGSGDRPKRD